MTHLFNRVKRDLYAEYEKEITELVEGRRGNEPLSPEEEALQQQVPEHLRISYARQQLLSLRAAKVDPCPLKCCEHKEEEPQPVPRSWDIKEAEQLEWEAQLKDALEDKKKELALGKPELAHMHRLQSESLRRLRQSVLEREMYKKHRDERLRQEARDRRRREAEEAGVPYVEEEEEQGAGAGAAGEEDSKQENLAIVREGGRYGDEFTAQRMRILEEMAHQLDAENYALKVNGM